MAPPIGSDVRHTESRIGVFKGLTGDGRVKVKTTRGPGRARIVDPSTVSFGDACEPARSRKGLWAALAGGAGLIGVGMFHGVGAKIFDWLWRILF
jgi:hypothetical protein